MFYNKKMSEQLKTLRNEYLLSLIQDYLDHNEIRGTYSCWNYVLARHNPDNFIASLPQNLKEEGENRRVFDILNDIITFHVFLCNNEIQLP